MTGLPIEWIAVTIVVLVAALIAFSVYMIIARQREDRRKLQAAAYLERHRTSWFNYLRHADVSEEALVPKNAAEVSAVEELFRMLVHNVKGDGMELRISDFSNRHLAGFYRKKLTGRNWGERVNALYRISEFHIDSLAADCRKMSERPKSDEEFFLLLLLSMKFEPEIFLQEHLNDMASLTASNAKELLFSMPDELFEETLHRADDLAPSIRYAVVDVIGMKADVALRDELEGLFDSQDRELRIRVLRAFNSLGILPSSGTYEAASKSEVWQERYQAARMLKRMPQVTVNQYFPRFTDDETFLVREEVKQYSELSQTEVGDIVYSQAAAAAEFTNGQQSGAPEEYKGGRP